MCISLFFCVVIDNGRLCMIYDHDITNNTIGPFAVGEWSKFSTIPFDAVFCALIRSFI
jgi:hypothetical protein